MLMKSGAVSLGERMVTPLLPQGVSRFDEQITKVRKGDVRLLRRVEHLAQRLIRLAQAAL